MEFSHDMNPNPTGIERAVCRDIAKRQEMGKKKYGIQVSDNPLTLRQWLNHAYEEGLDSVIYLKMAISKMDQQIMCIKRELFDKCGPFQGISFDIGKFFPEIIASENLSFQPRLLAEEDPSFKQLIPYCIIVCGEKILRYRRGKKGDETRLHGKYSIGIGGHVDSVDGEGYSGYQNGLMRELEEEIGLSDPPIHQLAALLNDDLTEVGSVHLGIVHMVSVENEAQILDGCDHLIEREFLTVDQLRAQANFEYEVWSQFCLDSIVQLLRNRP